MSITVRQRVCGVAGALLTALSLASPALAQDATKPADNPPSRGAESPAPSGPTNDAQSGPTETAPVAPDAAPPSPAAAPVTPPPNVEGKKSGDAAPAVDQEGDDGTSNGQGGKGRKKKDKEQDKQSATNGDADVDSMSRRALPGDPFGEEKGGAELGPISLRAMLQARYTATFAAPSTNPSPDYVVRENYLAQQGDGWSLNRFFLRISGDPSELVGLKAILDFAELAEGNADGTVKQAYAILKPIPKHLRFVAGLFKLPFSTMELDPIARYELADLGQSDALLKDLGFAGRDLGAEVIVSPFANPDYLHLLIGTFRGHSHDENDFFFGTIGARAESTPVKGLRLGVDMVDHLQDVYYQRPFDTKKSHVLPHPTDPFYPTAKSWSSGKAFSADVSFDRYHLTARVEAMVGDRVDADATYGARTFASVWGLAAYRFRLGPVHLMPAVRAEWLDGDREHKVGLRRELSAALNVILSKHARLLFDVTRTDVEKGSPILDQPLPLQDPPYLDLSNTRLVGQLQVEM
jgi:hypothetical protein